MITELPKLYCPFQPMLNPLVEEADAHTTSWILKYNLLPKGDAIGSFLKDKYTWLAGRMFPAADFDSLCIASDFYAFLFLLDDLFDNRCQETIALERKEYLTTQVYTLPDIFMHRKSISTDTRSPITLALVELETRINKRSTPEWQDRFAQSVKDTLKCGLWEYDNMVNRRMPSVADVIKMRQYGSGANLGTDLVEMVENAYLPEDVRQNETVKKLTLLSRFILCWANDLFSLNREVERGDLFSLVFAIKHEQRLTLEEAILEVARIHDEEVREFIRLEQQLPTFGGEMDEKLRRYVRSLRNYIRGNIEWSLLDTARYGLVDLKLSM